MESSDEILYFKFISDQEFQSFEAEDKALVSKIRYNKGVEKEDV